MQHKALLSSHGSQIFKQIKYMIKTALTTRKIEGAKRRPKSGEENSTGLSTTKMTYLKAKGPRFILLLSSQKIFFS